MTIKILALASLAFAIVGCGSTDSTVTKQEEQDFKGKPIPPGVLEKMKASQHGAPKTDQPAAPNP